MILYLKLQKAKQESLPVEKINKVVFDFHIKERCVNGFIDGYS